MNNKNEVEKCHEKEQDYENLFETFLNSDEKTTYSKIEVEKIIEAHLFKEVIGSYQKNSKKLRSKNLLVTSKEIGLSIFNIRSFLNFLISYIFYVGFLLGINEIIYANLFAYKPTVFIIALGFTIIDKFVRPFIFITDLVSFTIHKIGLITLSIYATVFFFLSYYLGEDITIEQSVLVALIVLACIAIIDFLKRDSLFKSKYIDEDIIQNGSDEDESY